MSHEIRTPLTSIIGFADLLQNNTSGRNARHASLIRRGGERLMDTLDSVLQLSKLEAGMVAPPTPQVMDLRSAAQETIELFRPDAESAGVRLQFESAPATVTGQWDSAAIQRVLSNLLSNAIKFTPEDGTVTVRVARRADEAVLTVSDTGIGISDAFRPRLFEAFTQESEGLEREHEGSGLGLAVVKRLVELMDGQIDVESTKGEGTCFRVRLPRPDPDPDA
jgi:signal transduction histidine kinase